MIARHWRGWTTLQNADSYEQLLREKVLPGLKSIAGYQGGYIFRRDRENDVEFVVLNFFDSLDSVRDFAGPDYQTAVFEPEALKLLSRTEPEAAHYEVRSAPIDNAHQEGRTSPRVCGVPHIS
jgi:heme-degrading monooxygenase HmoA